MYSNHIGVKALANEDTLLPTQMFPPFARALPAYCLFISRDHEIIYFKHYVYNFFSHHRYVPFSQQATLNILKFGLMMRPRRHKQKKWINMMLQLFVSPEPHARVNFNISKMMYSNRIGLGKRGHIVADTLLPTQMFPPFARARNICCGHKFCVQDTKNVSDFVQKHFLSATDVSQFAQPKKHHEQQCVRSNVSSFASTLWLQNLQF